MPDNINNLIKKTFESKTGERVHTIHQFDDVPNNSVYKVETGTGSYIFKIYAKRDWPEDGKLLFIDKKLKENQIPHAEIIVFDRDDVNFPDGYLIEHCLPGATADRLHLTVDETAATFVKLAKLMSRVHRINMPGYGYIGSGVAEWSSFSDFMRDSLHDNIIYLKKHRHISETEVEAIERELVKRLKKCDFIPSVLCHGDLSLKNILVCGDDITLIDWDDSYALCWIADIAYLTLWMKRTYGKDAEIYRQAFLDSYQTEYDKNLFYEAEGIISCTSKYQS